MGLDHRQLQLAGTLSYALDHAFPATAYKVTLDPDGDLRWADGKTENIEDEPETHWFKRFMVRIASWLPGEWLL